MKRFILAPALLAAALAVGAAAPAFAQGYPGPYGGGNYGSYGAPPYGGSHFRREALNGVVTSFNRFDLYVRTRGDGDQYVHLHQGTIINPTGATLRPGMIVNVVGYANANGLEANRIDVNGFVRGAWDSPAPYYR